MAPLAETCDESASNAEKEAMALRRVIAVTRWFISTLRSQYCSRNESVGSEKKPLNPFLGEVFVGKWPQTDDHDETILLSEQVSHHPAVTAYAVINESQGVMLQGYSGVKATLSTTSINVKQHGHAILTYSKGLDESYLVTLPPLHIEGLINASPYVELEGTSYIQSSNGYKVVIEYSGKGYFSGKKHSFKARIYRDELALAHKENALATISGQWSDKSYIAKGLQTSKEELFYDALKESKSELVVKPMDQQHELESRRAWAKVADAIRQSNYDLIHTEKSVIENAQREKRAQEAAAGVTWERRWFEHKDYSAGEPDAFVNLTNLAGLLLHNGPSGSAKMSKYDTGDAKHWRLSDTWKDEKEIKI